MPFSVFAVGISGETALDSSHLSEMRSRTQSAIPRASVVIPTFNGAARLPRVLAALAIQRTPDGWFEVIVVDNASTDGTGVVAQQDPAAQCLRSRGVEVRVVAEPRQGLTYARIAGIKGTRAEAVCFLDDDNVPDGDYVANGIAAFDEPTLGLAISHVRPLWESYPPPSVKRRAHLLALNDYMGEEVRDFGATGTFAPTIGAGLWVRRSAFIAAVPCDHPELLLPDRIAGRLASSGDIELGILIGRAGYHRVYFPTLRLVHEIPRSRLEPAYLCKLIEGIVRSELTLREKYGGARFGLRDRVIAWISLLGALCAIPALALVRSDAWREIAFVMAARRARAKGPLRELLHDVDCAIR